MKRLWRWIIGDWWTVKACGWPFPSGYATYNRHRRTILDTGLTKEHAKDICRQLNTSHKGG
jgi:hypothetical protein